MALTYRWPRSCVGETPVPSRRQPRGRAWTAWQRCQRAQVRCPVGRTEASERQWLSSQDGSDRKKCVYRVDADE
jgi:hypothetical protein